MLGDAEGEAQIGQFPLARLALRHDLEFHVVDDGIVARLDEEAAGNGTQRQARRADIRQAAGQQQAQVLLGGDQGDRLLLGIGGDDDLGEDLDDLLRSLGIERAVQRDDAAESRDGVAAQRALIGLEQRAAGRDAAGVGVLDDDAGGRGLRIELGDAFEG